MKISLFFLIFLYFFQAQAGIVFAVRGDQLNARYSGSGKEPAIIGVNNDTGVDTDQAGINGSTSIDLAWTSLTLASLRYNGIESTPSDKARSVLIRVKFQSFSSTQGLFGMGFLNRNPLNFLGAYVDTGEQITATVGNHLGQTDTGVTTGVTLTNVTDEGGSAEWHDIVVTWTGDNTTNGLEIWVDGTRVLQDTMSRSLPTYDANNQRMCASITVGSEYIRTNAHMYVDEFVVWDSVITPTSVTLTSGLGSLNGNARTAYVEVDSYDGASVVPTISGPPKNINNSAHGL